jgi:hypothetical protein
VPTRPKSYKMFFQNVTLSPFFSATLDIPSVSSRLGVNVLKLSVLILAFFASWRLILHSLLYIRRIALAHPLQRHNNCMAAATRESFAALASFRWHQPSLPLHKNVNSAASTEPPARHFGGCIANSAFSASHSCMNL